jgi:hypothetical protein
MELLCRIERFLRRSAMPATRFARAATGDPRFVRDLRNGRVPGAMMVARVNAALERLEREHGGASCDG